MRIGVLSISCLVLVSACGAANRSALHPALWTDGDRYAQAIDDACTAYEHELQQTEALAATPSARAAARALSSDRFDSLLEASLASRGLTRTGMEAYAGYHPGFFAEQQAIYHPRIAQVRQRAGEIAARGTESVGAYASR